MTTEEQELEEIRRQKAEAMLQAHHKGEAPPDMLDWSFRRSNQSGFFEICQKEEMVAVSQDANWASLVVDMLNSLTLAQQVVGDND
jgi:(2Fe-2S) ferredoxin